MKTIIASLLLTTLFQTTASAQVTMSDFEIYQNGRVRGVIFCAAFSVGAKTVEDVVAYSDRKPNASVITSDIIYRNADERQKKIFRDGWWDQMKKQCPNETKKFYSNPKNQ